MTDGADGACTVSVIPWAAVGAGFGEVAASEESEGGDADEVAKLDAGEP